MAMKSDQEKIDAFHKALRNSLDDAAFIELLLTDYRGQEPALRRVIVRRIILKDRPQLSFVYRYDTRDITKNNPVERGLRKISDMLGTDFRSAHLFTASQDMQIDFSKKGKAKLGTGLPSRSPSLDSTHDRDKRRYVDPSRPFLRTLGVTKSGERIVPAMARKWKQINKFIEIFDHALASSDLARRDAIRVVDFGSGKGYLTFAMYDYLQSALEMRAAVTGVELREDLVGLCTDLAVRLGMSGLQFRVGDVRSTPPEPMDALVALHACDTATDLAIHWGIRSNAGIIMCSPCCHKEIRLQMTSPANLMPVLKYGIHMGQEADMVTDALRALLLEAHGYRTQILEFVSLEHTSKNKLILAVRGDSALTRTEALEQIEVLKTTYGIRHQALETLLQQDST